ncbi:unnamed protein product [Effrenium voratum]|nr:unnamed protein product [Effrenium voratum]
MHRVWSNDKVLVDKSIAKAGTMSRKEQSELKTSAKVKVSPASTVTQSMLQSTGSEQPQALALPSSDLQRMLEVARGLALYVCDCLLCFGTLQELCRRARGKPAALLEPKTPEQKRIDVRAWAQVFLHLLRDAGLRGEYGASHVLRENLTKLLDRLRECADTELDEVVVACTLEASETVESLVAEGFLAALVSDMEDIPSYWANFAKDFPGHPVMQEHGDEVQALGGLWMFFIVGADDFNHVFTNVSDDAPYWQDLYASAPWGDRPHYADLIGFHISMVFPDLLHGYHLGVGRDMLGSILRSVLSEPHVFAGPTIDDRFQSATDQLRAFARARKLPLRLHKLSRAKISWKSRTFPELNSSGHDKYVVGSWLENELLPHTRLYNITLVCKTFAWSSIESRAMADDFGARQCARSGPRLYANLHTTGWRCICARKFPVSGATQNPFVASPFSKPSPVQIELLCVFHVDG